MTEIRQRYKQTDKEGHSTIYAHYKRKDIITYEPTRINDEPELSTIRRRSSEVDLSSEETLLVNPDCHVRVMLEYIRKKCKLGIYTQFDLCADDGNLKKLFDLPPHTNCAESFEHRRIYYVIVIKQETDRRVSIIPQLNRENKMYTDLKSRVKLNLVNSESSRQTSPMSKASPSVPSKSSLKPLMKKKK